MTAADVVPPSGEVTFLFTDVEGSTRLWERHPEVMQQALAEHDRRLREAIEKHHGYVFTTAGDSFAVSFASPIDGLAAAVTAQQLLTEPCGEVMLKVRMGLHTGAASIRDGDYFGSVVNRCARLASVAHGGQIIVSEATTELVGPALVDGLELVELGEHRLKDLLRPERIFQVRHPAFDATFPPLRTLDGARSNLPTQISSFIGREVELAVARTLLAENRLVTMTGSGGAGKTRLALQVAAEVLDDFSDGVRLVELGSIVDADLLGSEVATVIGAQDAPETLVIETITSRIKNRRMLLVIDNCEHLIDAVSELVERLLQKCPALKILATSRERLGISGEMSYRVPSLEIPDDPDPDTARKFDSVQLFSERAMLAKPGFTVTDDNVGAVVAICRRLDGIPLAIELAAARVRVLSPAQIAARLDERFRLLGDSKHGTVKRHRTLLATIDWSYDHLTDSEQAVFRSVGAFAGNFALEAAEEVCVSEAVESFQVLDALAGLVDKSMLVPEDTPEGDIRYRLLESMRLYAATKLAENGEDAVTSARHERYFVHHAKALKAKQRAGHLSEALAMLEQDEENFRAALRRSIDELHLDEAAQIVGSLGYLWYASGSFREGIDWCRDFFNTEPELSDELMAPALQAYATLLGSWAQPDAGVEMQQNAVSIRRRLGDPSRLAAALNNLGNLLDDAGRVAEADDILREAIAYYREAGESAAMALSSLAYCCVHEGDYDEATRHYSEALDEALAAGDEYGIALITTGLGECATHLGRLGEARRNLGDARTRFATLGVSPGVAFSDVLLAVVDRSEGDSAGAAVRLLGVLQDPDAQWYQSGKFWTMQLAAGLIADLTIAARLLGTVGQFYKTTHQSQPAWVLDDLRMERNHLMEELGKEIYAEHAQIGRRLDTAEATELCKRELRKLQRDPVLD